MTLAAAPALGPACGPALGPACPCEPRVDLAAPCMGATLDPLTWPWPRFTPVPLHVSWCMAERHQSHAVDGRHAVGWWCAWEHAWCTQGSVCDEGGGTGYSIVHTDMCCLLYAKQAALDASQQYQGQSIC